MCMFKSQLETHLTQINQKVRKQMIYEIYNIISLSGIESILAFNILLHAPIKKCP